MDYAGRLAQTRTGMDRQGVPLLAIPPGDDLLYLTGFSPLADERPCYLFIGDGSALFLVPELNAVQSEHHIRQPFATYTDAGGPSKALASARQAFGTRRRIAVGDAMRADALLLLQQTWPDAEFIPASSVLAPLRMRKSEEEIDALRRAATTADRAVRAAYDACRLDTSETAIAQSAAEGFRMAGADTVSFTVVASGPHSAFPHHHAGSRKIRIGEPVLFDLGGRLDGYWSDITRMAYLGTPPARYLEIHHVVEEAVQAALAVITQGAPIRDVDLAARRVIEAAGYGPQFTHRTGHGIGLSGHEPPSITHTNELALETGMAFSVEPGIYLPGEFGVRLEEIVVVTEDGYEIVSRLARDIAVLES